MKNTYSLTGWLMSFFKVTLDQKVIFIVISEHLIFKEQVKKFLNKHINNPTFHFEDNIEDATEHLIEGKELRVFIRKPPHRNQLEVNDILAINKTIEDVDNNHNFRALIFQKEHQVLTKQLNIKTIQYLKKELGLFSFISVRRILKQFNNY